MEICSPWEWLTLDQLMEDCFPWVGHHIGAGEEREESFADEEAAQRQCVWTNHNPHSPSPWATQGEKVEKIESKVKPGKKEGVGERCF